jgi:serine/threonine protein kinase
MSNFPDFSNYGYQVIRELGHNRAGGRVTYLANEINTSTLVVIKQFQFAQSAASWSEYEAYQQEIHVLKGLDHPNIPRYLDSFPTTAGFCMVQEYKNAPSLLVSRHFPPQDVKQIAISILNILKYLQNQQQQLPPVIHRDIKPDNILVDDQLNVTLVDFGFARLGGGEVAVSSVVKGTLGFMPPEQLFNRQLTAASDLYGLGATLICLLTGTASTEIGNLIDDSGRINFKQKIPKLSSDWVDWLQKMVEPNVKKRYSDAAEALDALIPLDVLCVPKRKKLVLPIMLGLATLSIATLAIVQLESIRFNKKVNPALTAKQKLSLISEVSFTSELNSSNELNIIPVNADRLYFGGSFYPLDNRDYNSVCRILDGNKKLVYTGQANLRASKNRLQTWCWYQFNPEIDIPGNWTFEFYLDGQKVAHKYLTVLPVR